jgi:hypothetical protein
VAAAAQFGKPYSDETGDGGNDKAKNKFERTPNAQWSRAIALGRLLDSAHINVTPRKRSGLKGNLPYGMHLSVLNNFQRR